MMHYSSPYLAPKGAPWSLGSVGYVLGENMDISGGIDSQRKIQGLYSLFVRFSKHIAQCVFTSMKASQCDLDVTSFFTRKTVLLLIEICFRSILCGGKLTCLQIAASFRRA